MNDILLAVFLGALFGFVLQRIGAADPDKIINMLCLKDLHLMKTILAGIGVSSILLFAGMTTGLLDSGHLSVKSMYWGVVIGGVLLGIGWGMSGFCPGTGVVAAGSGRIDALIFVFGGLVGAGLFTVMYGTLKSTFLMKSLFGGKTTLAQTGEYQALLTSVPGWAVAIIIGIALVAIAGILPDTPGRKDMNSL
ncbi:MAG: YeeE/YedE family protein [Desulfocapsa sp.]|nr:YeeE/YedE family protein [Desulfocapsa sp.]MBN4045864.1 YeeE/YedE family protein [bacterium AH-315-P11]MBN4060072.1 YeeE/YedE family protein [Desulfotalea psychrophila]